jgi:hypothetical protein
MTNDRLIDRPRLPDAYARRGITDPLPHGEFLEIDKRVGRYAGASGRRHRPSRHLYYNNDADPTAETSRCRKQFWNIGLSTEIGPVTLLAQGMRGEPSSSRVQRSDLSDPPCWRLNINESADR